MTTPEDTAAATDTSPSGPLAEGIAVIRAHLKTLTAKPGVYRMLDDKGDVLYVGKAKSLKARVASYTNPGNLSHRIIRMVAATRSMVFVTTHTEVEALLLEANLIKRFRPRYNVLLRDDKSFPFVRLDTSHPFPRIMKHRGARTDKAEYYGPFASAGAVNKTLNALQKAFLLRTCTDHVFESRSRPCLLYQIKRCAAPCVDRIDRDDYTSLVNQARAFLKGRSQAIQEQLQSRMLAASEALDFETAAIYRDRLRAMSQVQARQDINNVRLGDADVIAAARKGGQTCVQVFFLRNGQNWGNRAFYPRHHESQTIEEVLPAFIGQFYDNKEPPRDILVNSEIAEQDLLEQALSTRAGRRVRIMRPKRGDRHKLVEMAEQNAMDALTRRLAETASQDRILNQLADLFALDGPPRRIEVYDNSHISGTNALGAMIVAGPEGFEKSSYRKFNIKSRDLTPGDDYAMMREVMTRRFGRLVREDPERETAAWPDLVIVDGGAGQLSAVTDTLADLGIEDLPVVAIAKGRDRNAGREDFHLPGRQPFKLPPTSPVLYYIQRLRDEAHRFAIGGHRARRKTDLRKSALDQVPGVGAKRKRALLMHFGSASAVAGAGIGDLEAVNGISRATAKAIYDFFHDHD
ncbi:MAG: excinuclease ABC subunit UvrC [Alphaproteobacteria bacterium]|nr:MAG: excinuclease ABC subunit UvrC [Alphaproteobacteria bacterium]